MLQKMILWKAKRLSISYCTTCKCW